MTSSRTVTSLPLQDAGIDRLSVIGLGYIGLPTAVMFARGGLSVTGIDVDRRRIDAVNRGSCHIDEQGLDEILAEAVSAGRFRARPTPEPADAFIIAVPTPVDHDHRPDLSHVYDAARMIAPVLRKGDLIILESTCPVGTTRNLAGLLAAERPDLEFPGSEVEPDVFLAYCPERVIPGRMLRELVENDRIVGGMTARCAAAAARLYGAFVQGRCLITDDRTAEMVKLAENAFRDVNIAFANELSVICDQLGLDVWQMKELANRHPRVSILNPGPGVGGHCIAVDPWFIVASDPENARLVRMAREVNDAKPDHVIAQVRSAVDRRPGARVACFGLAYKPDVDDFRESPSLQIAHRLNAAFPGCVVCVDPFEQALMPDQCADLALVDVERALSADIIVVLVAHSAFRSRVPPTGKTIIDVCGLWR